MCPVFLGRSHRRAYLRETGGKLRHQDGFKQPPRISNRWEFDKIWAPGRDENAAIRHEIATAVQHSQEMLMDKLEKNRCELSNKLDHIPNRIIADLNNAKGLLQ